MQLVGGVVVNAVALRVFLHQVTLEAQVVLRQAHGIAQRVAPSVDCSQHVLDERAVHVHVSTHVDGARGAEESHSATLGVEHGRLADVAFVGVVGHNVARRRHPQRQAQRGGLGKVLGLQHLLMRDAVGGAMPAIVHDECAGLHLIAHQTIYVGELGAGAEVGDFIGIPENLLDVEAGVVALHNLCGCGVGFVHVDVALAAVAVVAHEAEGVLPVTGMSVQAVVYDLVDHHLGLGSGAGRQTAHADVGQVVARQALALALVEHAEEVVTDIAVGGTERVLALEAEQIVVGRLGLPVSTQHAVVPGTVAKEQQVAGHVGLGLGTVVEHLQVAAIGIGVGRTTGELVEELVSRHNVDAHGVVLLVEGFQPLGLCHHTLRGRNNDDQVGRPVGVMVLIGDAVDILRSGERRGAQVGQRHRLVHGEHHVVGMHVTLARRLAQFYAVVGTHESCDVKGLLQQYAIGIFVDQRLRVAQLAQQRVVHGDSGFEGTVGCERNGEAPAAFVGCELVGQVVLR